MDKKRVVFSDVPFLCINRCISYQIRSKKRLSLVVSHYSIRGCVRPLVGPSVGWSVCRLVRPSVGPLVRNAFLGEQRRAGERLISCIRTCFSFLSASDELNRNALFSIRYLYPLHLLIFYQCNLVLLIFKSIKNQVLAEEMNKIERKYWNLLATNSSFLIKLVRYLLNYEPTWVFLQC